MGSCGREARSDGTIMRKDEGKEREKERTVEVSVMCLKER